MTAERITAQLAAAAQALLWERPRVLLAVDGRCAAGKTTLAAALESGLGWGVIHMDGFFLRPEQRTPERLAEPGGNVDRERFREEVLLPLRRGGSFAYRPYDCRGASLGAARRFEPGRVTVVEGAYCCHPALRTDYDLRVFLTVDAAEQRRRLLQREGAARAEAFFTRWIPLEERYIALCRPEESCELRFTT